VKHDAAAFASPIFDLIAPHPTAATAIVSPDADVRLTYGALRTQIEILAGALVDGGVGRTERVAIAMPNGAAQIATLIATSSIAPAVLMPATEDDTEFASALDRTAPAIVVLSSGATQRIRRAAASRSRVFTVSLGGDGVLSLDGAERMSGKVRRTSDSEEVVGDRTLVLSSSGTRGPAKRVVLSQVNVATAARDTAATLGIGASDVGLCVMPLFHVHGLVSMALATLASGGTIVVPAAFHPLAFWRIARDHGATWYSAAPQVHQWLLARTADPGTRRPSGAAWLRFIRSAGAPLPSAVRQTLASAFGAPVIEGYEVTEASGEVASTAPLPREESLLPTSARVSIVDSAGHPLPTGSIGEVALAGPTVAQGYDRDPDATRKFFVDGWFLTGDMGYLDARGLLTLVRD
jgi:acyl-CoA synthetase (AMP-forming)/AMP-acid ligase II